MAETEAGTGPTDQECFARWKAEIEYAQKDEKYKEWLNKGNQIVKRYRDERATKDTARRFNVLWSNVETLRPAVYSKVPKPIVERRFLDRDPVARMASTILERTLSFQMEAGGFHTATEQAVLDNLLPGMGQTWHRYEPQFEAAEDAADNEEVEEQERTEQDVQEEGDGEVYEKLAFERVCVDYVFWQDFLWGPARYWSEVPWVARRCWMTTSEIAEKYYGDDMDAAKKIALDYVPERLQTGAPDDKTVGFFKKAEIWEIWNKPERTVYIIPIGTPGVVLKKEKNPILDLQGFWPCPPPLFATQTNETVVPVPDYLEYQDQAMELDDLTNRIAALTTALRVSGVYDASVPALARILQDGSDNKLIPVDDWAKFSERGGMEGSISLVPLKEIAETLIGLYSARAQVKNDLFEITGMSDIVRGQAEGGGAKTATEQRIKGQFASLRLEDRRSRTASFARSNVCIQAEIICEMFTPESLLQMSGMDLQMADEVREAVEKIPPPPEVPQEAQADPAMAQQLQQQGMQVYQQAQQQAAMQAQQKFMAEFEKAVQLLKDDRLRGFRVDIETDSTIASDAAAEKQGAVELLTGITQALTAAGPIVMTAPEMLEPIGQTFMFVYRRFRVGRSLEASWEDALDKMNKRLEAMQGKPPPPSPEEVKAQAEMAKQKAESDRAAAEFQLDMKAKQADMAMEKAKNDMEMQKMQAELELDRQRLMLERERLAIDRERMMMEAAADAASSQMEREGQREQYTLDRIGAREDHELERETSRAKAEQAKKPETK